MMKGGYSIFEILRYKGVLMGEKDCEHVRIITKFYLWRCNPNVELYQKPIFKIIRK